MIDFKSFVMAVRVGTLNFELKLLRSPKHPTGTVHHYDDEPEQLVQSYGVQFWDLQFGPVNVKTSVILLYYQIIFQND